MNDNPDRSTAVDADSSKEAVRGLVKTWMLLRRGNPSFEIGPYQLIPSPYPGLRSFDPSEGVFYFGRSGGEEDLAKRLELRNVVGVLGGSGSGKSSLVLAGLLPYLKRFQRIPGRGGRWYLVASRPGKNPTQAIIEAIWESICVPLRDRRFGERALATTFGTSESLTGDDLAAVCKRQLAELLAPSGTLDPAGLLSFANETLQTLDSVSSAGMQVGPANVLIVIDQFEELFREEVDNAGAAAVISLLKIVHKQERQGLFITFTMRSEEIHRCAEYEGLSEIVLECSTQVELLTKAVDLRAAIVEPARRVFESWGIPFEDSDIEGCSPFKNDLVEFLVHEAQQLSKTLEHKPDSLPLLQHALHTVWNAAIRRWSRLLASRARDWEPEVLLADFAYVGEAQPLQACLNRCADTIRDKSVKRVAQLVEGDIESRKLFASHLIDAAFICLSRRDDRHRWVRRFASTIEISQAAAFDSLTQRPSVSSQRPGFPQLRRERPSSVNKNLIVNEALGLFCRSGYVFSREGRNRAIPNDLNQIFDVGHEALIRSWDHYQNILDQAASTRRALLAADEVVPPDLSSGQSWWTKVLSWSKGGRSKRAAEVLGRVNSNDLARIFGQPGWLGTGWAENQLFEEWRHRNERELRNVGGEAVLAQEEKAARSVAKNRISDISRFFETAKRWTEWNGYRPPIRSVRNTAWATVIGLSLSSVLFIALVSRSAQNLLSLFENSSSIFEDAARNDPVSAQAQLLLAISKARSISESTWSYTISQRSDTIDAASEILNQKARSVLSYAVGRVTKDRSVGSVFKVSCGNVEDLLSGKQKIELDNFELRYDQARSDKGGTLTKPPGYALFPRGSNKNAEAVSERLAFDLSDKICVANDASLLLRLQGNGLILYPLTVYKIPRNEAKGASDENEDSWIQINQPVNVVSYTAEGMGYDEEFNKKVSGYFFRNVVIKNLTGFRVGSTQGVKIPFEKSGEFLFVTHLLGVNQPEGLSQADCLKVREFAKCEATKSGMFEKRVFGELVLEYRKYALRLAIARSTPSSCRFDEANCPQHMVLYRTDASEPNAEEAGQKAVTAANGGRVTERLGARIRQTHIGLPIVKVHVDEHGYLVLLDTSGKAWRYAVGWEALSSATGDFGEFGSPRFDGPVAEKAP